MSSVGAAPRAAPISNARAEASRRNGARSCGPTSPEGKARSAQNALKHGLRAQKHIVLPGEDAAAFQALEAALIDELAPEGALQSVLAHRIVSAAWRLARAERLEVELFAEQHLPGRSLGLALIRDGNGSRSFDTLLRYRGGTLAELWRALRTLKALQAEQAAPTPEPAVAPASQLMIEPKAPHPACIEIAPDQGAGDGQPHANPIEPEGHGNPGESEPFPPTDETGQHARVSMHARPSEPEPVTAVALARLQRDSQPNEPADGEAAAGWRAGRTAPEAIAPPRERLDPAAPAQPSRSTP